MTSRHLDGLCDVLYKDSPMIDVALPQLGESVTEGTISKWLVKEGDVVVQGQPILSVSTDKADAEVPAPGSGRIAKLFAKEGDVVAVNTVVAQIEEGAQVVGAPKGSPLASPSVRKEALEKGLDLGSLQGTGQHGRITKDDVQRGAPTPPTKTSEMPQRVAIAPQAESRGNVAGGFVPPIPGLGFGAFKVPAYRPHEGDQVIPFSRRRRITADHMTYSKVVSPHVVTVAEVDLHRASKLRDAHKDQYKKEGHALTMLAFVVVACSRALRETPQLNSRVLDDALVLLRDIHVGVAVDSPDGLVVPVIRHADELGVRGIVRTIDELAARAKTGKITIDDLSGATFSVSNPGLKGNLFGGAIINQPNVGILRMGEIQKRVVVVEGDSGEDQMAIHPIMFMALSYDHRVVDGVAANAFLWRVTELLEKADFEV
jgi:2-oxoglutarate dehydrogenase E2 component (dihydrolipoamide succinyltransferase)